MDSQCQTQTNSLVFYVNGIKVVENGAQPEWTLLFYLRNKLRLTGTKLGCGEGGCGACTVMISRYDRAASTIRHYAANACLTPVCALHGLAVTTVEGIGGTPKGGDPASRQRRLHAVQERLAKAHGSQCGFCTPGFVMSMYTLLRNTAVPTMSQIEEGFQGNLCRCTGYRPILEGCRTFTQEGCCGARPNGGCCRDVADKSNGHANGSAESNGDANVENGHANGQYKVNRGMSTSLTPTDFDPYEPTQEPIFPPELQLNDGYDSQFLVIPGEKVTWYRPTQLSQLLDLKMRFPNAKVVVGNTEVALEMKFKHCNYPVLIHPVMIPELQAVLKGDRHIVFGGSVSLSTIERVLKEEIASHSEDETRVFAAICQMLHWFAGKQIRNCASVAGNIMTGSPISDLNPLFMAAGCHLTLQKSGAVRRVVMDHQFFTGYRRNIVSPDEVLVSIAVPRSVPDEYFFGYKQSRRREDDIAIVNAGCRVLFEPNSSRVAELRLAFGGMAPTTVMANKTMESLTGRNWEEGSFMEDACQFLLEDLPLSASAPGGMSSYRQSLCLSFFFKFYSTVGESLQKRGILAQPVIRGASSVVTEIHKGPFKSTQLYELVPEDQPSYDPVGRPLAHVAAAKHVSGEAIYCDDISPLHNELYMSLLLSTKAHAKIVDIDPSAALTLPGVRGFFSAKDILQGANHHGPIIHDEQVFAEGKVTCYGQVMGCVVADTQALAQEGCRLVKVAYEDIHPVIVTIDDAIKHNSFYEGHEKSIVNGDVEQGFSEADHVLEGEFRMSGQEHFYLETQATIAIPKGEDGEMEIICSTQNPAEIQLVVSEVLNIPANRIVCRVKRLGGGFGGKETRAVIVALPAAVAAHHLQRPVRCMLDRDEDMIATGTRHPFVAKYKVGFTQEGRLTALQVQMYNNGGHTLDLSRSIMERAVFHIDNAYNIKHLSAHGSVCRTNLPSNTAFRGFGGPQGMLICENIVENVATFLRMDASKVRQLNMYREGDHTHFNQTMEHCTLDRCWQECINVSDFQKRQSEVEAFNKENCWKKRGIALIPTKFGIAFTALFLNQSGALVHIYKDGTVLVTHGGTEMGQGLHTKMIQVASRALGVPHSKVFISETSTDKVPNTSPTAASAGSDLNGMAVLYACQTLMERLEPIRKANPKGTWEDWIVAAYFQRISLSAAGFYKTPDIGYDFATNSGKAFSYFTYGAACSEVEVDCLTGNHKVLRTDIVMDLGESINPAIDIGQIEGGFIQGLGLFTLEEPLFAPNGFIITRGPSNYKIPSADDIPEEFNVSLLRGCPNIRAVYSSKAVGEPPLFLASSVFFAIKNAVAASRQDRGLNSMFQFDSPATAERIRMACEDHLTQKVNKPQPGTFQPWAVSI